MLSVSTAESIMRLLSDALLAHPEPKEYADRYITAATLQFRSHFRAAHELLRAGFEAEVWILIRSMSELLVRTKWVKRDRSNALWIVIGTEMKDLNRFVGQKAPSKLRAKAIQSIQQRLDEVKPFLPRNARYWKRNKPGEFAALPSAETMAKECGLLKVYRTWFKLASDHTHSSPRVLERFMAADEKGNFQNWILDPTPNDLSTTCTRLNCLAVGFMRYLAQFGWPIDKVHLQQINDALVQNLKRKRE